MTREFDKKLKDLADEWCLGDNNWEELRGFAYDAMDLEKEQHLEVMRDALRAVQGGRYATAEMYLVKAVRGE